MTIVRKMGLTVFIATAMFVASQGMFVQPSFAGSMSTVTDLGAVVGSCINQSCVCKGYIVKNYDDSGKEWGMTTRKSLATAEEYIRWSVSQHSRPGDPQTWAHPSEPMCIVDNAFDKSQAQDALRALSALSDRYQDIKGKFDLARELAAGDESSRTKYLSETFTKGNVQQYTDVLESVATTISKLRAVYSGSGANPAGRLHEQMVQMNVDLNRVSSGVQQYNSARRVSASGPDIQTTTLPCAYGITAVMCKAEKASPAPKPATT